METTLLDKLIEPIYKLTDSGEILRQMENLIKELPSLNEKDSMEFTVFHHLGVLSSKIEIKQFIDLLQILKNRDPKWFRV